MALLFVNSYRLSVYYFNLLIISRAFLDFILELLSSFPHISLDLDADIEINRDIDLFIKAKVKELFRRKLYLEALCIHVREVFWDRA